MNTRTVLLSLVITGLMFTALPARADDDTRQIAVTGTASVSAQPDIARISMAVVERNESLGTAQQAVSATTGKALELFAALDIERKYIDTAGLVIRPDYRWNRAAEEQELIGYVVERRIMVELRDLERLGELLEGAVKAGINQVSPPQFDHSKRPDLARQALADAVGDARANADAMAAAAGIEVGDVISISSSQRTPPPRPMMRAMAADAMAESAAESYVAGDIRFEASVSIVYELTQ